MAIEETNYPDGSPVTLTSHHTRLERLESLLYRDRTDVDGLLENMSAVLSRLTALENAPKQPASTFPPRSTVTNESQ